LNCKRANLGTGSYKARLFFRMDRGDSGKALIVGALVALAAAALSACVGAGGQDQAGFPKFSDIPAKPVATKGDRGQAEIRNLQAKAGELVQQAADVPQDDLRWADDARSKGAAPAPTAAEIDAEAYARQARARATPPPARK